MRKTMSLLLTIAMLMNMVFTVGITVSAEGTPKEDIVFGFNTDDDWEGWQISRTVSRYFSTKEVKAGNLHGILKNGGVPYMTVSNLAINAADYELIQVGIKYSGIDPSEKASVWFSTTTASISQETRVETSYKKQDSGASYEVLSFDMASNAFWKDSITAIRFDFFSKSVLGAELFIDYIKLTNPIPNKTLTYNSGVEGDAGVANIPVDTTLYKTRDKVTLSSQVPSREGYAFAGWSLEKDGTTKVTNVTFGGENVVVYATWDKLILNYEFAENGNFLNLTCSKADAIVSNHAIIGTSNGASAITSIDGVGINTDIYPVLKVGMAYSNLSALAQATRPAFAVRSFGMDVSEPMRKVSADKLLTHTNSLDVEEFTFNLNGLGTIAQFSFQPFNGTGNFTIDYIRFEKAQTADTYVEISFDGNGNNSGKAPYAVSLMKNEKLALPGANGMKRTGYVFKGWAIDPKSTEKDVVTEYATEIGATLYAVWVKAESDILNATITPASGSTVYAKNLVVKFKFNATMNAKTLIPENFSSELVDNVTYDERTKTASLYLKPTAYLFGGSINFKTSNKITDALGRPYESVSYTLNFKDYYEFPNENMIINGDFENANLRGVYAQYAIGSIEHDSYANINVYKVSKPTSNAPQITFPISLKPNTTYTLSYSLKLLKDNKGEDVKNSKIDISFYYDGEYHKVMTPSISTQDGWRDISLSFKTGLSNVAKSDIKFTAEKAMEFEVDNVFVCESVMVRIESGMGTTGGAPDGFNRAFNMNETITLPENTFEKYGYNFIGWTDGTTQYNVGDSYTITKSVTFMPVWKALKEEYVIIFDFNGAKNGNNEQSVSYNTVADSIIAYPDGSLLAKPGSIFIGWGDSANATSVTTDIRASKNATYYAIWKDLTEWTFNKDGNFENWVPESIKNTSVLGGTLNGTADGAANPIIRNTTVGIDASKFSAIEVAINVNALTSSQKMQVYFTHAGQQESEERCVEVPYTATSGDLIFLFNMYEHSEWNGFITSLRIDVSEQYCGFKIDSIKLIKAEDMLVFAKNTTAFVENMPADQLDVKLGQKVDLSKVSVPTRADGAFLGWSVDENGASGFVTSITIKEGINKLFAIWKQTIKTIWSFNEDGNSEGWSFRYPDAGVHVKDGCVNWDVTKEGDKYQPYMKVSKLSIPAANYGKIEIYTKVGNGNFLEAKPIIYFSNMGNDSTSNDRNKVKANIDVSRSEEFVKYTFDMKSNPNWNGTIDALRYDPLVDKTTTSGRTYKVQIDYIKLISNDIAGNAVLSLKAPSMNMVPTEAVELFDSCNVIETKWSPDLSKLGKFSPDTIYTATTLISPRTGCMYDGTQTVTLNGKKVDYTLTESGRIVIVTEFPITAKKPIYTIKIVNDEIVKGTVKLTNDGSTTQFGVKFAGDPALDSTVVWSVNNDTIASITPNGTLKALNNGAVIVTATSVFDESIIDTVIVEITGQKPGYEITYNANTTDAVVELPDPYPYAKLGYKLSTQFPVRAGYRCIGYTETPDGVVIDTLDITENTVVYAKWERAEYSWEFNQDGSMGGWRISNSWSVDPVVKGGFVSGVTKTGVPADTGLTIDVKFDPSKYGTIEIGMQSDVKAGSYAQIYFTPGGGLSEAASVSAGADKFEPIGSDKVTVLRFDMAGNSYWKKYSGTLRLDVMKSLGVSVAIDYIRILPSEFTATYNANGENVTDLPESENFKINSTYKVSQIPPEREGYKFLGWSLDPNSDKLVTTVSVGYNIDFYAVWVPSWQFISSNDGWTGNETGMTLTGVAGILSGKYEDPEMTPFIKSPDLKVTGSKYNMIKFTLRKDILQSKDNVKPMKGAIYFLVKDETDYSEKYVKNFELVETNKREDKVEYTIDMSALEGWYNNEILGIKIVPFYGNGTFEISDLMLQKGGKGPNQGSDDDKAVVVRTKPASFIIMVEALPGYYANDIKGNEFGWEFNEQGKTEGWSAGNSKGVSVASGCFNGEASLVGGTRYDPIMNGPAMKIDTAKYKYAVVSMKYSLEADTTGAQLFFTTDSQGLAEAASVHFGLNHKNSDGYVDLVFNLSENPLWKGTGTGFRFDPINCGGTYSVKYIKVCETLPTNLKSDDKEGVKEEKPVVKVEFTPETEWLFDKDDEAMGWVFSNTGDAGKVKGGFIQATAKQNGAGTYDPIITSPKIAIDADKYKIIKVGMKHTGAKDGMGVNIFFIHDDEEWAADRCVTSEIKLKGDASAETVEYTFVMSANSQWEGKVTTFRFDPADCAGTFSVDYIKLLEKEPLKTGEELLKNGTADDEKDVAFFNGGEDVVVTIDKDPQNAENNVYKLVVKEGKETWNYTRQKTTYEPGSTYVIEFDIFITGLSDGSTNVAEALVHVNPVYVDEKGENHLKSIANPGTASGWTHCSYEFTVDKNSKDRSKDLFAIYLNPVAGFGVSYLVDNLSMKKVIG